VLLSLFITPLLRKRLNHQFLLGARNQAFVTEYVSGMETVKSLQMEPWVISRYGEYLAGVITDEQRLDIVRHSCPGAGACGGMYTANTMASAIEALGMSLPYSSSTPAEDPLKLEECFRAGAAIQNLLDQDIKPRDIMTREAFENAMVLVSVIGGSTNAVLHLIAMARSVDVPLTLDDFQRVSDGAPLLADFKPSGPYVMEDLHEAGGIPAVMKMLLEAGLLAGNCRTVTGKTVRENLKDVPGLRSVRIPKTT